MIPLLLACAEPQDSASPAEEEVTHEVVVRADPEAVVFVMDEWGATSEQTLLLVNEGDGNVSIATASTDADDVTVDANFGFPFSPGVSGTITLGWTPTTTDDLDATLELLVTDSSGPSAIIEVPLSGSVSVPELDVSSDSHDFGTVSVGCSESTTFTVTNRGTADLAVDAVTLVDAPEEYTVTGAAGVELGLPWTLAAGESRDVEVTFTPQGNATVPVLLRIDSSDPITPANTVSLSGTGHIDGEDEITYYAEVKSVTVLIAVNAVAVFSRDWDDAIPVLFEELSESRADWRVAFLTETTGEVVGDQPYIDNEMSESERETVMEAQLENTGGDNDYLLQTLDAGVAANRDWLIDDDEQWYDSTLNLIGMNSDVEQSTGSPVVYVDDYQSYKADPTDVFVHAIAGEQPSGCSSGSLYAEPSGGLQDAARLTGGTFLSWCDDWATNMETIADAALSGIQRFELNYTPDPDSIVVRIDEVVQTDGWTYDEEDNRIIFDDEHFPPLGSEVTIYYLTETTCD